MPLTECVVLNELRIGENNLASGAHLEHGKY